MTTIQIKDEPQDDVSTFVEDGLVGNFNQTSSSSKINVKTECEVANIVTKMDSPSCSNKDSPFVSEEIDYGLWKNVITSQIRQRFQEYFTNLNLLPLNLNLPRGNFQSILSSKACTEASYKEDSEEAIEKEDNFIEENDSNFDGSLLENETQDVQLNKSLQSFIDCNSIFTTFVEHNLPKPVPSNESKNIFKCWECNSYYSRKFNLTRHIVSVHRKVKQIKCEHCDLSFSHKKLLSAHMLVHEPKKSHKCLDCERCFEEKEQLNQHKILEHGNERPFKCLDCDNTYSRKFNLTRHILSVHKKLKPHKCPDCDSTFSLKNHLDRHIQSVHENKKPFKCNNCDSAFNRKEHLSQHLLLIHRNS